ncbi:MAG: CheR family methyltransferase [Solirubrobacteraceae bacterium]
MRPSALESSVGVPPAAADIRALGEAAGLQLADYRAAHVAERVRRALEREEVLDADALAALLRRDPAARARFRRAVAVSVSGFFRDPHQFDLLEAELLPPLLASRARLRAWSAGSAEGQELYSLGILLERAGRLGDCYLLGSDLLEENLAAARAARHEEVTISEALRACVRWEQRDLLVEPPPPGGWDLVLCRNLAIYVEPAARDALHARLAAALTPGGVLLLGRSERLADPLALGVEPVWPHAYRRRS